MVTAAEAESVRRSISQVRPAAAIPKERVRLKKLRREKETFMETRLFRGKLISSLPCQNWPSVGSVWLHPSTTTYDELCGFVLEA